MAKQKKRAQPEPCSGSDNELPITKTPRSTTEAAEILEDLHENPTQIASFNIKQCCDILKCFNKTGDKRLTLKYLDLLDTISNTLLTIGQSYEQNDNNIKNILEEIKQDIRNKPTPSYSQILQREPQNATLPTTRRDEKTIIVKPNDNIPPQIIENKIKNIIKNSTTKTKVNTIFSKKRCVIIKTPNNDTDCEQLLNQINTNAETKNACQAYEPKKRDPTILIKNVTSDTDLLTITQQMVEHNPELEGLKDQMKFLFKLKHGDHTAKHMNIVFRVSPQVYHIMTTQMNNRIYLDFQCCNIHTKIFVRQCQKCFNFNHKTQDCQNHSICKTCGEHKQANHSCTGNICCFSCKNSIRYKNDTSHSPNTEHCPLYKIQIDRLKEQTQYKP